MGIIGDAYAAMQPPRKCICGSEPQGHPSGLCDVCVAKRSAPPAPRRPVAGWVETVARGSAYDDGHTHTLTERTLRDSSGRRIAKVATFARKGASWIVYGAAGDAPNLEAAQLAAEDALRAVLVDAAAALGLRVVPS